MKISHIEHLGIAVQSIEESLPYFTDVLGLECYATEVVMNSVVILTIWEVYSQKRFLIIKINLITC